MLIFFTPTAPWWTVLHCNVQVDKEEMLDVFRFDPNFEENEQLWEQIKKEILGDDDDEDEDEDGEDEGGEGDDEGKTSYPFL